MQQQPDKLKITLIMVMSANGVVAQNKIENSFEWNSEADRKQFLDKVKHIGVACMGANTFRSVGCKPYDGVEFYVLTNHPEELPSHERVTYLNGDVEAAYKSWQEKGYRHIALLGGPHTNTSFLEKNLVDEIYLTVEPIMMPDGMHIVNGIGKNIALRLENIEVLNPEKTLLLHYLVKKH